MRVVATAKGWDGKQIREPGETFDMEFPEPTKPNDVPAIVKDGVTVNSNAGRKEPSKKTASWFKPATKEQKGAVEEEGAAGLV